MSITVSGRSISSCLLDLESEFSYVHPSLANDLQLFRGDVLAVCLSIGPSGLRGTCLIRPGVGEWNSSYELLLGLDWFGQHRELSPNARKEDVVSEILGIPCVRLRTGSDACSARQCISSVNDIEKSCRSLADDMVYRGCDFAVGRSRTTGLGPAKDNGRLGPIFHDDSGVELDRYSEVSGRPGNTDFTGLASGRKTCDKHLSHEPLYQPNNLYQTNNYRCYKSTINGESLAEIVNEVQSEAQSESNDALSMSNDNATEGEFATVHEEPDSLEKGFVGYRLLFEVLVRGYSKGIRCSLFSRDTNAMKSALRNHGILVDSDTRHSIIRGMMIRHIFMGQCHEYDTDIPSRSSREPRPNRVACRSFSSGYSSAQALSGAAFDIVRSAYPGEIVNEKLCMIGHALGVSVDRLPLTKRNLLKTAIDSARKDLLFVPSVESPYGFESVEDVLTRVEDWPVRVLRTHLAHHRIKVSNGAARSRAEQADLLTRHLIFGHCSKVLGKSAGTYEPTKPEAAACSHTLSRFAEHAFLRSGLKDVKLSSLILDRLSQALSSANALKRILRIHGVVYEKGDSVALLRRKVRDLSIAIREHEPGEENREMERDVEGNVIDRARVRDAWPQLVKPEVKETIHRRFRDMTSSLSWSTKVCAVCSERCFAKNCVDLYAKDIDLNLIRRPDRRLLRENDDAGRPEFSKAPERDSGWLGENVLPPKFETISPELNDVLLDPKGVRLNGAGDKPCIQICKTCESALKRGRVPAKSIANHNFLGDVPPELKDLTPVEEAMVARCRAKCWIIQLKDDGEELRLANAQRGVKGNIIVYPQQTSKIATCLPPSLADVASPICVIFVGSTPPTAEWLREKAKPLTVRREKVRRALIWLKLHNPLYKDIIIDHGVIDSLEVEQTVPVDVQHVLPKDAEHGLTSRYDAATQLHPNGDSEDLEGVEIPFQNVVITDIDGNASANELRAAAVRHIKSKGGGYIQIPHGPDPVNSFDNPNMFPLTYPSLFPYGMGGFEQKRRATRLSMQTQVKHLFNLSDRRFQEHYSFLFTIFNVLQRRKVLLQTYLKTQKSSFPDVARAFSSVTPEAVAVVCDRVAKGDTVRADNEEERRVLSFIRQVNGVTSLVPGSSSSKVAQRNEIRGMMIDRGMPSFFVTVNPADIFHPLVKFLSSEDIDVDNLLPNEIPKFWEQSVLVSRNPAIAATFFNRYIQAFISTILAYDKEQKDVEGGALGVVSGYYGCVEAQGRGTLHCHMLVWLEGGLNPNEIKKRIVDDGDEEFARRLLAFLDDTISTEIPPCPEKHVDIQSAKCHPCNVRGVPLDLDGEEFRLARDLDRHYLAARCQKHKHTKTCYKYSPDECRFNLDGSRYNPASYIDYDSGNVCLRCLDGMVNNYNETMLEALRCNMDIKFIGGGADAKALLYYITDYVTKSQVTTYVAFTALKLAVEKVEQLELQEDDLLFTAKRLLQKGAYSMLSQQELSAQQVCSYLMGYEDHFKSHEFENFYWTVCEKYVNGIDPSPECYTNSIEERNSMHDGSGNCTEPIGSSAVNSFETIDSNDMIIDTRSSTLGSEDECRDSSADDEPDGRAFKADGFPYSDENLNEGLEVFDDGERLAAVGNGVEPDDARFRCCALEGDGDDEVILEVDSSGCLIPKSSQLMDYVHRDGLLKNVCMWDFVAQFEKVKRLGSAKTPERSDWSESDSEGDDRSEEGEPDSGSGEVCVDTLLRSEKRIRARFPFLATHDDSSTHELRVRSRKKRRIPVPVGPGFPRNDSDGYREKYSRLMLIIFKPWQNPTDLRLNGETWSERFGEFRKTCSPRFVRVMDNIQLLHECKDSRDDHFAKRRTKKGKSLLGAEYVGRHLDDDIDFGQSADDGEVLLHLLSTDKSRVFAVGQRAQKVEECLDYAKASKMFDTDYEVFDRPSERQRFEGRVVEVEDGDFSLERDWSRAYDDRREAWKKRTIRNYKHENGDRGESDLYGPTVEDASSNSPRSELPRADRKRTLQRPVVKNGMTVETEPRLELVIRDVVGKFTLNTEQERAFRIVAEHSGRKNSDQLRMFMGGAGGTGKSQVIKALTAFFDIRQQAKRFRLASYTGVAARNVAGVTLHSSLSLNHRGRGGIKGKAKRDLVAIWEDVEYLFVDEVSMLGCKMLYDMDKTLRVAKDCGKLFGGVNVIFAGDFAQLRPINETRLFAHVDTRRVATVKGQENVFGKLLWLSVKTVVILKENKRLIEGGNNDFLHLLNRLRGGICTEDDLNLLNSRLLSRVAPKWEEGEWYDTPVIVSDNAVKDAFNEEMAVQFARRTGQDLHWYYASDSRGKEAIVDNDLKDYLIDEFHSGQTSQRLGKVPLVVGMPVIFCVNFDVEGGVVNGCRGIVREIRYVTDERGNRHATSCVVESDETTGESLPHLPKQHVVALTDTVPMYFTHPYSKKRCVIRRTQLPIQPAFALTTHKAQGQTLKKVIVDIQSCRDPEAPYVMLSRVTSLEGLLILRPFEFKKINYRLSQEQRIENNRLEILSLKTLLAYGDREEREAATVALDRIKNGLRTKRMREQFSADNREQEEFADELDVSKQNLDHIQRNAENVFYAMPEGATRGGLGSRRRPSVVHFERSGRTNSDASVVPRKRRIDSVDKISDPSRKRRKHSKR